MNKRIFWISAVVITLLAFSLDAVAQGPGQGQRGQGQRGQGQGQGVFAGGAGGGATLGALVRNAEALKMLEATAAQTTALAEAVPQGGQGQGAGAGAGQRGQGGAGGQGGAALTPEARRAAQVQRVNAQWDAVYGVLNAGQQAKFKEIFFQANNGLNAAQLDARILDVLGLTADQKEKVAAVVAARTAEFPPAAAGGQQNAAERRAAMTRYNDQIKALLTAEQTAKATQLTEGAAALRTALGLPPAAGQGQRGQGQGGAGAAPGGGQRGAGAGGAGFTPGQNSWQPGQGAPAGGGQRGQGGVFPREN